MSKIEKIQAKLERLHKVAISYGASKVDIRNMPVKDLECIIDAIEKEIPANAKRYEYEKRIDIECGVCNHMITDKYAAYCSNCGTKIGFVYIDDCSMDWSE